MSLYRAQGWHVGPGGMAGLLPLLLLAAPGGRERAPSVANDDTRIEAAGEPGRWTGARICGDGQEVALVEFTSGARWTASSITSQTGKRAASLTFRGFHTAGTGNTPHLAPASFVRITIARGDPFPRVDFRFEIESFDVEAWDAAWSGRWPLHFLSCSGPQPHYYYHGGWLTEIPVGQPPGSTSREAWSPVAAISSLGIPAAGLWQAGDGRLVVYSFQHARSTDGSCKEIVIGYHRGGDVVPGDWMALLWPGSGKPEEATCPSAPAAVESHFDLLYDLESGPASQPTDLVLQHTWSRYRDLLPTVPRMNDLGWMVERHRLPDASAYQAPASGPANATDPVDVWQYARMFIDDSDKGDAFDPSFLMFPLGAKPQAEDVDWAALGNVLRSMIETYVETGDPRLKYCIRGALERWPSGFAPDGYRMAGPTSVAAPSVGGTGCLPDEGPLDSFWEWAQPVGDAILHVTAGQKAAIAFCRGTTSLDISDYRFQPPASFGFTITGEHDGGFPMILSSPGRDLADVDVYVGGEPAYATSVGARGQHLRFTAEARATVQIGEPGDGVLESGPIPTHPASVADFAGVPQGLECLDLASEWNTEVDVSWEKADSWAGLPAGRAFGYGVPYAVQKPTAGARKIAAQKTLIPVNRRARGIFLVCSKLSKRDLVVMLTTGPLPAIDPDDGLLIRTGRPLRDWELWLYPVALPENAEVEAVWAPSSAHVFAITIERRDGSLARHVRGLVENRRENEMAVREAERTREKTVLACQKRVRRQLDRKIIRAALLPPHGPLTIRLRTALHRLGVRSVAVRDSEVASPGFLTPTIYPILIAPWPDACPPSGGDPSGAAAAIRSCLGQRGTLLAVGTWGGVERDERMRLGRDVGLDLLVPGEQRDDSAGLSAVPEGELILRREKGQDYVTDLPDEMPLPGLPDLPFTPVVGDRLPRDDEFTPLLTLYGRDRERLGVAMGIVKRRGPELAGAKLIWVWGGLLSDGFAAAHAVLYQALATAAELCTTGARADTAGEPQGKPYAPAVGILPLAETGRAELVKSVCADMNLGYADVSEGTFVEPLAFNPSRFPIAVHAAPDGGFLQSWRLPHDGTDAYLRYLREGGFLLVCGGGPPLRCPVAHVGNEWQGGHVVRPALADALPLPLQSDPAPPASKLRLVAAPGERRFPGTWKPIDLPADGHAPCCLAPVRAADVEWRPLAYLTDTEGHRHDGYAAAIMRLRGAGGREGTILYLCGELIQGERRQEFTQAALRYAMDEVQELPAE